MTKKLKPQPRKIVRSAGTGRFVKKQLAKTDKKGTVTETVGNVSTKRKLIVAVMIMTQMYCQACGISLAEYLEAINKKFGYPKKARS